VRGITGDALATDYSCGKRITCDSVLIDGWPTSLPQLYRDDYSEMKEKVAAVDKTKTRSYSCRVSLAPWKWICRSAVLSGQVRACKVIFIFEYLEAFYNRQQLHFS